MVGSCTDNIKTPSCIYRAEASPPGEDEAFSTDTDAMLIAEARKSSFRPSQGATGVPGAPRRLCDSGAKTESTRGRNEGEGARRGKR